MFLPLSVENLHEPDQFRSLPDENLQELDRK